MSLAKEMSLGRKALGKLVAGASVAALLACCLLDRDARAASILMITDNDTTTQSLNDFLVGAGHSVTRGAFTGAAPTPAELAGVDVVLVARETNSGNYDDGTEPQDWNALTVPMISMAPHLMRSNRWGWIDGTSLPNLGDASDYDAYPDTSHPFLAGVASTTILDPPFATTGAASALPGNATVVATFAGDTSHGVFTIPAGTEMFNGLGTAGGLRVGYLRGNEGSWDNITGDGQQILLNMINTVPEPTTLVLAVCGLLGLALGRRRRLSQA